MRTAGSTRLFRPESVSDDVLYRVLDNARFAPSGGNRQGWRVIVIREQALRVRLKELYLRSWRPLYPRQLERAANDAHRRHFADANHYAEHLDEVPVAI
jgi:nitroreductase